MKSAPIILAFLLFSKPTTPLLNPQQLGSFQALSGKTNHIEVVNISSGPPVSYAEGLSMQDKYFERSLKLSSGGKGDGDTLLLLTHSPILTLGSSTSEETLSSLPPYPPNVKTNRGGDVTYHGPGQITIYPILNLANYKKDIHWYLRALEETAILALGDFDVVGAREEGVTGVFVGGRKIASVGVKVRRWTTMHGIGVNVGRESLGNFQGIKPCGMDRDVTCLEDCCDREVTVEVFGEAFCRAFEKVFNCVWK